MIRQTAGWVTWYRVVVLRAMFLRCMVASFKILSSASDVRTVLCLPHSLVMNTNIPIFQPKRTVIKCLSVLNSTIREMRHHKQHVWWLHCLMKAGYDVVWTISANVRLPEMFGTEEQLDLHRTSSHDVVCWARAWLVMLGYDHIQGPENAGKPLHPVDSSFTKWFIPGKQVFQEPVRT